MTRAIGSHHSARPGTVVWLTPPEIIDALGPFDLDPCSPMPRPWRTAKAHYYRPIDGLKAPWRGRVWLNPPYTSSEIGHWLRRLADHGQGTALIFARTETENFVEHVWRRASGLLFLFGRLHFHDQAGLRAKANAGAPSVLCAYGQEDLDRLATCGLSGQLVPLRLPKSYLALALDVSWREALRAWLRDRDGPVELAELYRAFAPHPKARRNRHWRQKIRQTLQRGRGAAFEHVRPGVWRAA